MRLDWHLGHKIKGIEMNNSALRERHTVFLLEINKADRLRHVLGFTPQVSGLLEVSLSPSYITDERNKRQ